MKVLILTLVSLTLGFSANANVCSAQPSKVSHQIANALCSGGDPTVGAEIAIVRRILRNNSCKDSARTIVMGHLQDCSQSDINRLTRFLALKN